MLFRSHATGGTDVGAVTGMGAHVTRQAAGLRAGLAAEGALNYGFAPRPVPPPLARPSRASTRFLSRQPFPSPLASGHRHVKRLELRPSGLAGQKPAKKDGPGWEMAGGSGEEAVLILLAPFLAWAKSVHVPASPCSSLLPAITAARSMSSVCPSRAKSVLGESSGSASCSSASNEHAADIAEEKAAEACKSCLAELGRVEGNWEGLPVEVRAAYLISCVTWAAAIMWQTAEDGGDAQDRASALRLLDLALLAVKADVPIESLATDLDPSSSGAAAWMGGDEGTSGGAGQTHPRQIVQAAAVALHEMLALASGSTSEDAGVEPTWTKLVDGAVHPPVSGRATRSAEPADRGVQHACDAGGAVADRGGKRQRVGASEEWGAAAWREDGALGVGGLVAGAGEGERVREVDALDVDEVRAAGERGEPLLLRGVTRGWPAADRCALPLPANTQ